MFRQTVVRSCVKFLPWEFFHTLLWHWEGWPTDPAPPTTSQIIALSFGWVVIGLFLSGLFIGNRRTFYDLVAGTIVISKSERDASH